MGCPVWLTPSRWISTTPNWTIWWPISETKGLEGLEVYSPEHTPDQIRYYQKLAGQYGLVITGGTDFHGANKPELELGIGRGNFRVPYVLLNNLKERRDEVRSS